MVDRHAPARISTPYLRRRTAPIAETAPPQASAATAPPRASAETALPRATPRGLDLSHHRPTDAPAVSAPVSPRPKAARPRTLHPFPAPGIHEVRELGVQNPVIRLTPLQSAIGSLIVTSARSAAWESTSRISGSVSSDGDQTGSSVMSSGNRPLVAYSDDDVVMPLRHLRELRRALFVAREGEPIGIQLFDGTAIAASPEEGAGAIALHLLRIDNLIELRAEPIIRSALDEEVYQQFGFVMTAQVAIRDPRNR